MSHHAYIIIYSRVTIFFYKNCLFYIKSLHLYHYCNTIIVDKMKNKLTYSLNYRKPKDQYSDNDELMVCIRYYHELVHKFENPLRVGVYCFAFVLLALHLLHGFSSSLKSLGANKLYAQSIRTFAYIYSIGIPLGFCVIAIYHYYNSL